MTILYLLIALAIIAVAVIVLRADAKENESGSVAKLDNIDGTKPETLIEKSSNEQSTEKQDDERIMIPERIGDFELTYHYKDVEFDVTADLRLAKGGESLTFTQDGKTVLLENSPIGTVGNERIANMIKDFLKRSEPITAILTFFDDSALGKMFLAFYRKPKNVRLKERGDSYKKIKLTGTGSEDHQSVVSLCAVGEVVDYEYDYEKEKYSAICGDTIGFFPKSAVSLLENSPEIFISEIELNDKSKYDVYVDVFC